MNPFVANPDWGWWIILYFYCGGLAAGTYFLAGLIEIAGNDEDRVLARIGYRIAFPLVALCGVLLIIDLDRPERFWHMIFQSEVVEQALEEGWPLAGWDSILEAPMIKWWSPMSIGALALGLFGLFTFLSFLAALRPSGRWARLLAYRVVGLPFHVAGCAAGFFIASYTGVLLTSTNQPLWSLSEWIGPLFLASAASTGIGAVLLLSGLTNVSPPTEVRLRRAELRALVLELAIFLIFLASLGNMLTHVLETWQGQLFITGTLVLALLFPLATVLTGQAHRSGAASLGAACALAGGFIMRYGMLTTSPALLVRMAQSPPDGLGTPLLQSWQGKVLLGGALALGILLPLVVRRQWRLSRGESVLAGTAALLMVAGVTFYSLRPVAAHPEPLFGVVISPEDERPRGGGPGASAANRPAVINPRSKLAGSDSP